MKHILISFVLFHSLFLVYSSYSQFSLPNRLSVLLKHSPFTNRNGIGILVEAGSSHEPRNFQGLAHLLEHMLFMASKKYPKEGYFKELLGKSHGNSNAMTSDTFTVYFFDINAHSPNFELIADVFSRFFIDPILHEETLSREINAVNNEYENDLNSNEWRFQELMRTLADPQSAFNHFCIGNRDTLKINSERGNLKNIMIEFYEKFYVSSKMHLFINSNLPIKKMKKIAVDIFGRIPSRPPFKLPIHLKNRKLAFPNHILGSLAWYKPIGNLKMMSIIIPFEDEELLKLGKNDHYFYYIEKIIKDKSKGSIYSQLKNRELILSLDIGRFDRFYKLRIMSVRFLLTAKGVGNVEKILQIFYDGLKKLKPKIMQYTSFKKIGIRNFISFVFREKLPFHEEIIQTLFELREGQKFEQNEILKREIFVNFDKKAINRIFDRFIPEKSIVIFASEDFLTKPQRFKAYLKNKLQYWRKNEPIIINNFKFEQQFIDSSFKRFKSDNDIENDRRILRFYVKGEIKTSLMSEKILNKFEKIMQIYYAFERMPLRVI
jgi:secreted Zn-dependent insulinase-like peptidase